MLSKLPFSPDHKSGEKVDIDIGALDSLETSVAGPRKATLGEWAVLIWDGHAEVQVPSSSGKDYYGVCVTKNTISCHCRGYEHRNSCRHVKEVREVLERQGKSNGR